MREDQRPAAVGVHIYSGAFSVGMSEHYRITAQLEEGPWGAETFKLNFPDADHPLQKDQWRPERYCRKCEAMYANPPCAPWSVIGSRQGINDPRLQFSRNCFEAALVVLPDFFVIESVCRAWTSGGLFYREYGDRFRKRGYEITYFLTNALLHGGCQWRERFHLVAHRWKLDWQKPEMLTEPPMTVNQVIGDIADSSGWYDWEAGKRGEVDVLNDFDLPNHCVMPPTDEELAVYERLTHRDNYNKVVEQLQVAGVPAKKGRLITGRLMNNGASRTMVDLGSVIHPTKNRVITLREGLRLCGYSDDFLVAPNISNRQFGGTPTDVTQVVIPTMGRFFGDLFRRSRELEVLAAPATSKEAYDVIDWRHLARNMSPGRWYKIRERRREREREEQRMGRERRTSGGSVQV